MSKKTNNKTAKKEYLSPEINIILLDSQVSIQLESEPTIPGKDDEIPICGGFQYDNDPYYDGW